MLQISAPLDLWITFFWEIKHKRKFLSTFCSDQEPPLQTELPMSQAVQTSIIPSREDVDPDIFSTMTSLNCFKNEDKLYDALLSP